MSQIPTKQQILDWVAENPEANSKRDIAKAFRIKGAARIDLKRMLKELEADGLLARDRKQYHDAEALPPVTILVIEAPDSDGDIFAKPLEWKGKGPEPRVLYVARESDPALGAGDRILAKLIEVRNEDHTYQAKLIRKIANSPQKIVGIYRAGSDGGRIVPIDKGADREWRVRQSDSFSAENGELVEAEQIGPKARMGLPKARITQRLGDPSQPKAISLIAIHQHNIPDSFPQVVIDEAEAAQPTPMAGREDLRDLPLVTIDPPDARDHDDAVAARIEPDGGATLWVAIADVAFYVRAGSELDREARMRGNSTYFPDRVVPMLPEALSADLCSLHEGEDRPAIVAEMRLDAQGNKASHSFKRAMIRSAASLAYAQAQAAADGNPDGATEPLVEPVIKPLWHVFDLLTQARKRRQPLDLDLPERQIELMEDGRVKSVNFKARMDAHKLIEECMVLANVAAAETLIEKRQTLLFRVHEEPDPEKLDALREVAVASGFNLAKGQVLHTSHLNKLLAAAEGSDFDELINMSTLRSMTQAYYHPENFGHFGLSLKSYAHFTSPIRRYADLVVHRALVSAHGWGDDGLSHFDVEAIAETAKQISDTERRSMTAERDTNDRYLAAFLADRIGNEFKGRIAGVQKFGAFVKLDETGADGLLPIGQIGNEYFIYDREAQTLEGADTGTQIGIGQRVTVRLSEATAETGGLILELLELEGEALRRGNGGKGRRRSPAGHSFGGRKKAAKSKILGKKRAKAAKRRKKS